MNGKKFIAGLFYLGLVMGSLLLVSCAPSSVSYSSGAYFEPAVNVELEVTPNLGRSLRQKLVVGEEFTVYPATKLTATSVRFEQGPFKTYRGADLGVVVGTEVLDVTHLKPDLAGSWKDIANLPLSLGDGVYHAVYLLRWGHLAWYLESNEGLFPAPSLDEAGRRAAGFSELVEKGFLALFVPDFGNQSQVMLGFIPSAPLGQEGSVFQLPSESTPTPQPKATPDYSVGDVPGLGPVESGHYEWVVAGENDAGKSAPVWLGELAASRGISVELIKLYSGGEEGIATLNGQVIPGVTKAYVTKSVEGVRKYQILAVKDISKEVRQLGIDKFGIPKLVFDRSISKVELLVLHDTGIEPNYAPVMDVVASALRAYKRPTYNYIIERDGTIYVIQPPPSRAFHVGNLDSIAIGISFNTRGHDGANARQLESARNLVLHLIREYKIDPTATYKVGGTNVYRLTGHREIPGAIHADPVGIDMGKFRQEIKAALAAPMSSPEPLAPSGGGGHAAPKPEMREVAVRDQNSPLTYTAYQYDTRALVRAIELVLAQYNSPIQGYGSMIVEECRKQDVDPAFFMANAGEETLFGQAYRGRKVTINGVEYDFLDYFHNIIGYTPRNTPEEKRLGYHRFSSWEEMIKFWPKYIRTKYLDPETSFTGSSMDTLVKMQPIYAPYNHPDDEPGRNDGWIPQTVSFWNQFLAVYRSSGPWTVDKFVWQRNALMFHGVGVSDGISVSQHEELILGLKKAGYTFVSLQQVLDNLNDVPLPDRWVLLTYDDARADFYQNAYPFLKRNQIPAVLFVPTEVKTMSDRHLKEVAQDGLVELGTHSRTHPHSSVFAQLGLDQLREEIAGSKTDLERLTGKAVRAFCYPGGGHNERVERVVRNSGYQIAFAVWGPQVQGKEDVFRLGRVGVDTSSTVPALIEALGSSPSVKSFDGSLRLGFVAQQLPIASDLVQFVCSTPQDHLDRGAAEPALDLCAVEGTPIRPAAPGKVIFVSCRDEHGFGCWVQLYHNGGYISSYAHCQEGSIRVSVGQEVGLSDTLCLVGRTGQTTFGPHLHVSFETADDYGIGKENSGNYRRIPADQVLGGFYRDLPYCLMCDI